MRHISIEGMDGVGKTTTCELLAKRLGFKSVYQPMRELMADHVSYASDYGWTVNDNYTDVRNKINQNPNRVLSSMFYGLGSVYMYEKYKYTNIVTDRHLCSNYAWSGTEDNKEVYDLLLQKLGKPELTVILYASPDVINARLLKRNKKDSDLGKVSKSEMIYKRMISFCTERNLPFIVIDSSNLSPEEVVEQIIQKL